MLSRKFLIGATNIITLCLVIFFVSMFFIYNSVLIGYVLIALALVCLATLWPFGIKVSSVGPDIVFGIIDNGILAIMAVVGGKFAGVAGAIIGGAVGNAITDGIAGIFEGLWAESLASDRRTMVGSAVGKMAGCLLGAGVVLAIAAFF